MRRGVAALLVSVALGACGAGHGSRHAALAPPSSASSALASSSSASPPQAAPSRAPQLVAMRRIDGATWQTIEIRTDGTGDDGIFIGEWAGTHHRSFRIGAAELARLDRLVALARQTPEEPYFGTPAPSIVYIVYVQRHVLQLAPGHTRRPLVGLTDILSGLIDQYS